MGREGGAHPVGDRYVVEEMRKHGYSLGGEQSGHLVFLGHATTGDGTLAALQVLAVMCRTGKPMSELTKIFEPVPQVLLNVMVKEKRELSKLPTVLKTIAAVEKKLGKDGRVLVRYSGTEPKVRVLVEGIDAKKIHAWAEEIGDSLKRALGRMTLHFRDEGDGTPLLLLHGLGASGRVFDPLFEKREKRRLISVDLPRTARSGHWASSTPEHIGAALIEFLDKRKVGKFEIFGHSFGGLIALHLGATSPQRISKLSVASTPALGVPPEFKLMLSNPLADMTMGWFGQDAGLAAGAEGVPADDLGPLGEPERRAPGAVRGGAQRAGFQRRHAGGAARGGIVPHPGGAVAGGEVREAGDLGREGPPRLGGAGRAAGAVDRREAHGAPRRRPLRP